MKKVILFLSLIVSLISLNSGFAQINCSLKVTVDSITHLRCFVSNDGAIRLKVINAKPPISYNWSAGVNNYPNFYGLRAGNYSVTVTDSSGCRDSIVNIKINQDTPKINVVTTPSTNGQDGTATITITKGTTVFSHTFTNLRVGTYNLAIVDAQGCAYSIPVTITGVTGSQDLNTEGLNTFDIVQNTLNTALVSVGFNEQKAFELKVFSLNGQVVFHKSYKEKNLLLTLNTNDLPKGLLLFALTVNGQTITKKQFIRHP